VRRLPFRPRSPPRFLRHSLAAKPAQPAPAIEARRSEQLLSGQATIFGALMRRSTLPRFPNRRRVGARGNSRYRQRIIAIKNIVMSIAEQEELLDDICNVRLGFGPLEPLLSRDDISDIMVNGAGTVFIEVAGRIQAPESASVTTSSS